MLFRGRRWKSAAVWLSALAAVWLAAGVAAADPHEANPHEADLKAADRNEAATPPFDDAALEFFEKQVRPILVARCYECHSDQGDEPKGGLRVDSRKALLAGGDTGPALEPGQPAESLLIDAINYGDIYQMPPRSKLPAAEIAVLTRWVSLGAPWPAADDRFDRRAGFDLAARKAEHWAWRPLADIAPPETHNRHWPAGPIDQFVLARLEQQGLTPAPPAERATLLRRLYFDLIGLPPTPAELAAYLADESDDATARVVDRLLRAPQFGERWARHWLDLARYAESRGHEFDYNIPNVHHYRDYVIRALNADVPYDQFVREHIAGDLLAEPRRHPAEGFNEAILGTGFWFLGEWVHSPVDLKQDEADRVDNMLDVATKTFLGMTVACARCHDHKFDAISQADYYALAGFVHSSSYRQVRFDTHDEHDRQMRAWRAAEDEHAARLLAAWSDARRPVFARLADEIVAAAELARTGADSNEPPADIVFDDFEQGNYARWTVEGTAFGDGPVTQETIAPYQGNVKAQGRFFVNSHNVRTREGGHGDTHVGRMTSEPFRLERAFIHLLVGGGAHAETCVQLLVDDRVVLAASGTNNNEMRPVEWDVSAWRGAEGRLRIIDNVRGGWGNIGVDHIVFSDRSRAGELAAGGADRWLPAAQRMAAERSLDARRVAAWAEELTRARADAGHLLHPLARALAAAPAGAAGAAARQWAESARQRAAAAGLPAAKSPAAQSPAAQVIVDYAAGGEQAWLVDGPTFGPAPRRTGDILLSPTAHGGLAGVQTLAAARRDPFWNRLELAAGAENEVGRLGDWQRAGRTLRTPTFEIETRLYYLVRGAGQAYAVVNSHWVNQGPLHGAFLNKFDTQGQLRWITHDVSRYAGHRAHVEFSPQGDGPFEVLRVVQGVASAPALPAAPAAVVEPFLAAPVAELPADADARAVAAALVERLQAALAARAAGDEAAAHLVDLLLRRPALTAPADNDAALAPLAAAYRAAHDELASQVRWRSRLAPAMWDGTAVDERLFIRGNPKTPGPAVPRRFLAALADPAAPPMTEAGSGRRQLAEQIVDPANPLTSRVIVNRVWHHLFGRGLTASVDNLGELGEPPTHPELLDWLARDFMDEGWSLKGLIRQIVLSRTYQQASAPRPAAGDIDPDNRLLHRMNLKRLQGESIRDAVLAISGRLNPELHGPSVPVHLTEFMQGRGRPGSGPLDGHGRRSVYLSVRRNFLSPLMLAFDTPIPFTTVGRRNVSNVPAQALIMMNDPLIAAEARRWAERELAAGGTADERIARLYVQALGRAPSADETAAAHEFLAEQAAQYKLPAERGAGDVRVWADLCHVLWNTKEFLFVQ